MVTLVGMGCGTMDTMTTQGVMAYTNAYVLIGAERLLNELPEIPKQKRIPAIRTEEILDALRGARLSCVLYSGDLGFYSGARLLIPKLRERKIKFQVLPGISAVQVLAARLARPWQDWNLYSAHGTDCDPVAAVMGGKPAFFLTGGADGPSRLCTALCGAGLGDLSVTVGEALTYEREKITRTTAAKCAGKTFDPLSVVLIEPAPCPIPRRAPGLPDGAFVRGDVPMTKQEVRAAVLGKLAVRPGDTVWDVGAGTGSVSVELALAAPAGRVYAVEYQEEALSLIRQNREKCGAWNLCPVPGRAPEALEDLPAPDAVFIGGTNGKLTEIIDAVLSKNPAARLCVSAIALETLSAAAADLAARGLDPSVTQIAVSRTKPAGALHLLTANNPVFLITAGREAEA